MENLGWTKNLNWKFQAAGQPSQSGLSPSWTGPEMRIKMGKWKLFKMILNPQIMPKNYEWKYELGTVVHTNQSNEISQWFININPVSREGVKEWNCDAEFKSMFLKSLWASDNKSTSPPVVGIHPLQWLPIWQSHLTYLEAVAGTFQEPCTFKPKKNILF